MLEHACNVDCGCSSGTFEPVCGIDGTIYFSPCHAGCTNNSQMMEGPMGPFKVFSFQLISKKTVKIIYI